MKKVYLRDLTAEDITKRLQNNGVVYYNPNIYYKFVNGVFCKFFKTRCVKINAVIDMGVLNNFYFEEQEPLTIEVKGFHKIRDGHCAICYAIQKDALVYPCKVAVIGEYQTFRTTKTGNVFDNIENKYDIVAKRED